eukprot:TRINITY_DN17438_c0_g1_i1.p1 TRINITY_DN17438_c0_g1~~TRINITY_DN17438_c0_g1_i1.p1  ORF type:complete len:228 (-),score=77.41 TRINITY_DN17438_c0_g1_i1:95-778(-)
MSLMGLLGDYGSDSNDSDESDEETTNQIKPTKEKAAAIKAPSPEPQVLQNPFGSNKVGSLIPKPSFMQEQHSSILQSVQLDSGVSVFRNPFRDKEDKKKAILEQHVNMTQRQEELKVIDGKKVCWMYRKGRCRNGSKCKFAHDSDVKAENLPVREEEKVLYSADSQISSDKSHKGAVQPLLMERELSPPPQDGDDRQVVRKKRPGLSENLVPSKKAMDFHKKVYKTA